MEPRRDPIAKPAIKRTYSFDFDPEEFEIIVPVLPREEPRRGRPMPMISANYEQDSELLVPGLGFPYVSAAEQQSRNVSPTIHFAHVGPNEEIPSSLEEARRLGTRTFVNIKDLSSPCPRYYMAIEPRQEENEMIAEEESSSEVI